MKILITGANGNLGSNLINFFSKDQKNLIFGLDIHDSSIIKKITITTQPVILHLLRM